MKDKKATVKRIASLSMDTVRSVYTGKAHKCCCGCSGIHRHNSYFPQEYDYQVNNNNHVQKVINVIKNNPDIAFFDDGLVYVEFNGKVFIAYTGK